MHALISLSEAYIEAERQGFEVALAKCRDLLEIPGLATTTTGTIWSQLGLLNMRAGDRQAALGAYNEAIPNLADSLDTLARALLNRSNIHLYFHDPSSALADLRYAVSVSADKVSAEMRGKIEHNLGYANLLTGDLVGALRYMDAAARTLSPMTPVLQSVSDQDRAEVLLAAGRIDDAAAALESAAAAYGAQRLRRFQAECEFVLARTVLPYAPDRAAQVARRAAGRFEKHASAAWATRSRALATIADITRGRRTTALRERTDTLVAELTEHGHQRDAELLSLHGVRLAIRRGDLDDARLRLREIRLDRDTPIGTRLLDREVRAELASAQGQRRRALAHVRAGLDALHAWQSSFGSLDLQSTLVGHGNHLARLGLRLALDSGDPATLFEWSERARALASRVTPVRPPPDDQLAADLAELRMLSDDDAKRRRSLRERIRQQSWYGEGSGTVGEPTDIAGLQGVLRRTGATLVAHIALDETLTALVIGPRDTVIVPLGDATTLRARLDRVAADLDFAARNHVGPLAVTVRQSLQGDLDEVGQLLVTPILDLLGDRRVVLTPSALLAGTPWTLLPGLRGRPLTVPPSATRWRELVSTRRRPLRRIGLVAGPRVPRAEEEVHRAAEAWGGADILVGADADSAKVSSLTAIVDLLHIAGHGSHAGEHPLFSAVDLADGPWFGHDLDLLDRVPSVVVLSACELGQVSVRAEESVGMSAAWLHAGARTVVSSPAQVADDAVCEALAFWHRLVAAGHPPADALAAVIGSTDDVIPLICFGAGW